MKRSRSRCCRVGEDPSIRGASLLTGSEASPTSLSTANASPHETLGSPFEHALVHAISRWQQAGPSVARDHVSADTARRGRHTQRADRFESREFPTSLFIRYNAIDPVRQSKRAYERRG